MGSVVVVAEKPSQARDYAKAYEIDEKSKHYIKIKPNDTFREGATITWAVGHLLELYKPQDYDEKYKKWSLENLPIIPDTFRYQVMEDKKEQFNQVVKLLKQANIIINATDADRAGEAIFQNIVSYANITGKPIKRLWINSLHANEIRKGMKNLIDSKEKERKAVEEQAREKSDWLIGMNLSPLVTLLLQEKGYEGTIGVGRVQTPTVYLIYQRQKEIKNFISKPFFQLEGNFKVANGSYKGMAKIKEDSKEVVQSLLKEHELQEKIDNNGVIESVEKKEKQQKAPQLHSLDTLQKVSNKKWKYTLKTVLDTVQELYDKKILTYPRTETNYITENEFNYIKENVYNYQKVIGNEFPIKTLEPKKEYVDGSKVQEHYAIVPTEKIPTDEEIENMTSEQKNIYFEILYVTLGMFAENYIYEETTIITDVNGIKFKSTGKVEKEKGWKALFPEPIKKEKDKDNKEKVLPLVEKNESSTANVIIKEGKTQPPKPYTEGQLVDMMITCGKHVEDEEEYKMLKETGGLGTNATRSDIVEKIKKEKYIEINKNIVSVTEKGTVLCEAVQGTLLASPSMTAKWEEYLKKIGEGSGTQEQFLKTTTAFINKTIQDLPQSLNANTNIPKIIEKERESKSIAKCPSCQKGDIVQIKTKQKKTFYACSEYKNGCQFSLPNKYAGKVLTTSLIQKLCQKKETQEIKGFKSTKNKGKTFSAKLYLDNDFKLKFSFKK
ncbi:type IA DNA topoisomerase [Oceanobacillus sp. FSL K6-0251]|uniref:type IA DNA topoisomerase n=1 Tax=Oceanobacillus sp. FSL K6-0251 TaxID=2921602 RepID=UPI0030F7A578